MPKTQDPTIISLYGVSVCLLFCFMTPFLSPCLKSSVIRQRRQKITRKLICIRLAISYLCNMDIQELVLFLSLLLMLFCFVCAVLFLFSLLLVAVAVILLFLLNKTVL